jgi:NADPH2:quinone reductase
MATQEIPKQMYGIAINKTGGTDVLEYLEDLSVPTPGDGQILVKNDVTGVNYIDTYISRYNSLLSCA